MSKGSEEPTWCEWFCSLRGNEFLVEVEEDYIQDKFNLTGLSEQVPHYNEALNHILDIEVVDDDVGKKKGKQAPRIKPEILEQAAELLYGLIHCRYILSPKGLNVMVEKFKKEEFGVCPRIFCEEQSVLPVGLSDVPGENTVKLYCPKCRDVYAPRMTRFRGTDGAYFGSGFPHMFFMVNPELRPASPKTSYNPKLFGFKIHPSAYEYQRKASKKSIDSKAAKAAAAAKDKPLPKPNAGKS